MTIKEAKTIVHSLSKPSKMPCKSWGISIAHCKVGAKLALIAGSVCASCFAGQGLYTKYVKTVAYAHQKRLEGLSKIGWIEAMAKLIGKDKWFRFFDSGDLQDVYHLCKIIALAKKMPDCLFWLPTKEEKLIRDYCGTIPQNLIIRISASMIGQKPKRTMTGLPGEKKKVLGSMVNHGEALLGVFQCLATSQGGKCLDCRACWNTSVPVVAYKYHGHTLKKELPMVSNL